MTMNSIARRTVKIAFPALLLAGLSLGAWAGLDEVGLFAFKGIAPGGAVHNAHVTDPNAGNMYVHTVLLNGVAESEGSDFTIQGDGTTSPTVHFTDHLVRGDSVKVQGGTTRNGHFEGTLTFD